MTAPAASTMNQQIALAFPTLIGRFQISDTEAANAALLAILLDREAKSPSNDYANVGGWHSSGDLLEWPHEEVRLLKSWISEGLNRMVQATGQLPEVAGRAAPPRGSFRISAWGNISRRGNYHRMHNHPGSAWSGCYYVTGMETTNSMGGVLELYDPRPFTEMVDVPGTPYGQRVHVRPVPGLLILFPSWLYHFVHPSDSDTERVSIAFNASWWPA
ncbi:MAG: TIGR02466 family protein [Planctomycetota bacterium]|nr:TIGR02466 family protein [Planctomycetota bacterium]